MIQQEVAKPESLKSMLKQVTQDISHLLPYDA
jgi:hypothetical protein